MWIENSKLRSPGLAALVPDGEQVVTGVSCAAAPSGLEQITEPPHPVPPPAQPLTGVRKIAAAAVVAVGTAVSPPAVGGNAMMRFLGGIRAAGTSDAIGPQVLRTLEGRPRAFLVVTDRRLLLTDSVLERQPGAARATEAWSIRAELDRGDVVAARRRTRSFVVGRVELYFRDGSMVAVMTAAVSPRPARRLLRALGVPRTPPAPRG